MLIALMAMLLLTIASCTAPEAKNDRFGVFFDNDLLEKVQLSDLPVPELEGSLLRENTLYLALGDEAKSYANSIIDHLRGRDDIYFLSAVSRSMINASFKPGDVCTALEDDFTLEDGKSVTLVFSHKRRLGDFDELLDAVRVTLTLGSGTVEHTDVSYDVAVKIEPNSDLAAYYVK